MTVEDTEVSKIFFTGNTTRDCLIYLKKNKNITLDNLNYYSFIKIEEWDGDKKLKYKIITNETLNAALKF